MPITRSQAADLLDALVSLLRVSRTVAHRDVERSVSATPITILRLVRNSDLRLGNVAEQAQIKPSVASRVVASLEADGYVTRTPDPEDARALLVTITEAGQQHLRQREDWVLDMLAATLEDWTTEDAAQSVKVLQRLELTVQDWVESLQNPNHPSSTQQLLSRSGDGAVGDSPPPTEQPADSSTNSADTITVRETTTV